MELGDELEDGELGDYSPLPRPILTAGRTAPRVRDSSSDDDDDEDSDGAKRPRLKCLPKPSTVPAKFNVWAENLQEEALTEKLVTCDVVAHDRSRDVESYFVPRLERSSGANKRRHNDGDVRDRLGPRPPSPRHPHHPAHRESDSDSDKGEVSARHLLQLRVTCDSEPADVATDIANKLLEEKDELVGKVVQVMGVAKAIELFDRTRDIEADGGMMILNGARRRTPGGVFFYLTRTAGSASREQLAEMFESDVRAATERRRRDRAEKRRRAVERLREARDVLREDEPPSLPPLPSRADAFIARQAGQPAAASEHDDGEIVDSDSEVEGMKTEAAEPAMDPRAAAMNAGREIAAYDDDFLQVDADIDLF